MAIHSEAFIAEIDRLQNQLKEKDRELEESRSEIKALKSTVRGKEKALEEVTTRLSKLEERLEANEELLESKNLEVKKLNDEKKAATATQYAAETALRKVFGDQEDEELVPLDNILAPYEAEIRGMKHQILSLQEDNKALERLSRSKESALLDAQNAAHSALSKAQTVDDLHNTNLYLTRQLEICQEENKILDKMHRQKVCEVEKLSENIHQLEEAILSRGAIVNAIQDYERQLCQLMEEKKTLQRELSRAKLTENRVAASSGVFDRSDDNNKVIPMKMWLYERRCMQAEIQQLKDKLAIQERAAKSQAKLKEKLSLRLKVLEGAIKETSISMTTKKNKASISSSSTTSRSSAKAYNASSLKTRSLASSASRHSSICNESCEGMLVYDSQTSTINNTCIPNAHENQGSTALSQLPYSMNDESFSSSNSSHEEKDIVSGVLYDMLQKKVITLKKAFNEKDKAMQHKNDTIENLSHKVETLKKAMESEAKKMRRQMTTRKKEEQSESDSCKQHHQKNESDLSKTSVTSSSRSSSKLRKRESCTN